MAAVSYDGSPEKVSGSVQLIPKVPYGTLWRVDSGEDIYTVPASQINCDIINGRLFRSGKQYVDIFAEDLGTIWTAIYTNVIVEGRPRHIHSVDFMVTPGEYIDLNRVGEVVPEPVWITLGTGFEARDQLRAALSDRGLGYSTVTEIPFEIELVGTGSVEQLFQNCYALTTAPEMDMSRVTNMKDMFSQCRALTHIPDMDTSQATNMRGVFYNCQALTQAPVLDTSQAVDTPYMFANCSSLTHVPDMDTSQATNMRYMFSGCSSLTHGPKLNTSQVVDSAYMYQNCTALIYVPDMDTSQATDMRSMFSGCSSLTDGNVLLNGRNPNANTIAMIEGSGLTKEPFNIVQITLGTGIEARNQFLAALSDRGLDHTTVTEVPFKIELVGTGTTSNMFRNCYALKTAPSMDTSNVTSMERMFQDCYSLTSVPDMNTSNVTNVLLMFSDCSLLTDGNVRLIGKHPSVGTSLMIDGSGLTREPFYLPDSTPDDDTTTGVYSMTLTDVQGTNTAHPLVSVTVPAGETWSVRIKGTVTKAPMSSTGQPVFRIGTTKSGRYGKGAAVNFSGTVTASDSTIAMITAGTFSLGQASFTGIVTIEK